MLNLLKDFSSQKQNLFVRKIINRTFVTLKNTVVLAQLVRAPDCGSGGRGFEPHIPPFMGQRLF